MTWILPEPTAEDLRAASTTSQKLAEGARRSAEARREPFIPPDCVRGFESVFAKEDFDILPEHRQWDHAIKLIPGSEPKSSKVYPLSPVEQKELDTFLGENLRTGRIHPSKSPMAAPVFFIKKKDGSLWLVQDYHALNSMMVKNKYPLPLISELVSQLRRARYFTKLDVCWGFNNIRIKPRDKWKAAFRTNRGLFEPLVMFFGMTNSPTTFQTMMNDIFQSLIAEGIVVVYLDNILIFTQTKEDVRAHSERRQSHHNVVTNFIRPYIYQFFDDSHGLKASLKPLKRPFDRYQSRPEAINNGRDIRQINW